MHPIYDFYFSVSLDLGSFSKRTHAYQVENHDVSTWISSTRGNHIPLCNLQSYVHIFVRSVLFRKKSYYSRRIVLSITTVRYMEVSAIVEFRTILEYFQQKKRKKVLIFWLTFLMERQQKLSLFYLFIYWICTWQYTGSRERSPVFLLLFLNKILISCINILFSKRSTNSGDLSSLRINDYE